MNKGKRLAMCEQWKRDMETDGLDLKNIFWTDEKAFRLGTCPGGNQNSLRA